MDSFKDTVCHCNSECCEFMTGVLVSISLTSVMCTLPSETLNPVPVLRKLDLIT